MSQEFCWDVPDPWGGSKSLCKSSSCSFFVPEKGVVIKMGVGKGKRTSANVHKRRQMQISGCRLSEKGHKMQVNSSKRRQTRTHAKSKNYTVTPLLRSPFCLRQPRNDALVLLGVVFLVSHCSAISDTVSCDAPYSATGFRGKLFLRYPPS